MTNWSVYKRSDGRWCAERKSETGKKSYIYGKSEAAIRERINQYDLPLRTRNDTLAAYLPVWLDLYVKRNVRERTVEAYEGAINTHIIPSLGHIPLKELTEISILTLITSLTDEQKYATAQLVGTVLRLALETAANNGLISTNPALKLRVPRGKKQVSVTLSPEQVKKLLTAADRHPLRVLWYLGVTMGLRSGELRGLRWRDIDLGARKLTVNHQLQRIGGVTRLTDPKSASSRRELTIPMLAYESLVHHYEDEVLRGRGGPDHYLFYTERGTTISSQQIGRSFKKLLTNAGLPDVRIHDLRHTCATLLVAKGIPMKTVQSVLGHSDYRITANLYSHTTDSMLDVAADEMDRLLA